MGRIQGNTKSFWQNVVQHFSRILLSDRRNYDTNFWEFSLLFLSQLLWMQCDEGNAASSTHTVIHQLLVVLGWPVFFVWMAKLQDFTQHCCHEGWAKMRCISTRKRWASRQSTTSIVNECWDFFNKAAATFHVFNKQSLSDFIIQNGMHFLFQ